MRAIERWKREITRDRTRPAFPALARAMLGAASVVLILALPGPTCAQDAPHWASDSITIDCTSQCHVIHNSQGGTLTAAAGNVNLCQSCHNPSGLAQDLSIDTVDKADPHVGGTSHAFDVPAVDAGLDTQLPQDTQMALRVYDNNIVCSTCHNQHKAEQPFGGSSRVAPSRQTTSLGSTGTVNSTGTFTGAEGVWYLIEIVGAGNENTAAFCYSKDNGISWFPGGCNPPGVTNPNLSANGSTPVALDSGVDVTFATGSFAVQERWEFSASWPFLRATLGLGGSALCGDCHQAWVMDHTAVEQWNGGSIKSHPVGVALDVNGAGYDRANPLDGNGLPQNPTGPTDVDGNPTNDLEMFDAAANVECLTCHGVHFVDSNTLSVDPVRGN